jgi:hypothetical protein
MCYDSQMTAPRAPHACLRRMLSGSKETFATREARGRERIRWGRMEVFADVSTERDRGPSVVMQVHLDHCHLVPMRDKGMLFVSRLGL